ncbi:hypothetical protein ElyMa_003260400 [Elysia marginata]|uniref:Uncharacterized protein n=1 Tax=Elysia marginata TaxID=1093978 RepID=A0AAV4JAA3_9GAST|nr:hypothetical protein ElyMa_003260400 [Elysia marginata]
MISVIAVAVVAAVGCCDSRDEEEEEEERGDDGEEVVRRSLLLLLLQHHSPSQVPLVPSSSPSSSPPSPLPSPPSATVFMRQRAGLVYVMIPGLMYYLLRERVVLAISPGVVYSTVQ